MIVSQNRAESRWRMYIESLRVNLWARSLERVSAGESDLSSLLTAAMSALSAARKGPASCIPGGII